jgi:hypothetical protein
MAEATQFSFDLREATIALIKQQGLHEGFWMIAFEFNFTAGMLGSAGPADVKPAALMQIAKLQLIQAPDANKDIPFVVDAAKVNPAAKEKAPA